MINICALLNVPCNKCAFEEDCGIDFPTYETMEYWKEELEDKMQKIQYAIDKLKELESETKT